MADVGRILPTLPNDQHRLATAGGLLLFVVFGIKAAMLPVGFWLPKTYAVAATPVAALFTAMMCQPPPNALLIMQKEKENPKKQKVFSL